MRHDAMNPTNVKEKWDFTFRWTVAFTKCGKKVIVLKGFKDNQISVLVVVTYMKIKFTKLLIALSVLLNLHLKLNGHTNAIAILQ